MSIQNWSDTVLLVELQNDPTFSDDVNSLLDLVEERPEVDVVVNLSGVTFLNSSNIAKLLKLRKLVMVNSRHKLKLCAISTHVWGVFLVTGLDKIFDFCDDVASGLAAVQIEE